jgi:hypothetical protein
LVTFAAGALCIVVSARPVQRAIEYWPIPVLKNFGHAHRTHSRLPLASRTGAKPL